MLSAISPKNGNLTFTLEPQDRDDIETLLERHGGNDEAFLVDMLDLFGFMPNGRYFPIDAKDVGAHTCAPLLATEVEYLDDGARKVHGDVWWYPNYMVSNFAEVLARDGRVTFMKAH